MAAFAKAAGGEQYYSGMDQEAHLTALVAELNRRGGLAGRPVRLVFRSLDATSSESWASQEQASCDAFTQDHRVKLVMTIYVMITTGLDECLAKRGVPLVVSNDSVIDTPWYQAAPRFTLQTPDWGLAIRTVIERLAARRLVSGKNKIGILAFDHPSDRRHIERLWRPMLKAAGLAEPDVAYLHYPTSTADLGTTLSQLQGVVLRWKTNGIDVVFDNGGLAFTFHLAASQQDYYPFYGLTTRSAPAITKDSQGFRGAGIGWSTNRDTGEDGPRNAAYLRCKKLSESSAGGSQWPADAVGKAMALMACDALAVLERAATIAGDVTPTGLVAGIRGIGSSIQSAQSFGMRLDQRHPAAVIGFRDLTFDTSCTCPRYTSPIRQFG